MHVLEAGFETPGRPCVLLLHGFPELAFSLAQGDAGAGRRRLSRDRAGPARLWPHHRMPTRPTTAMSRFGLLNLVRDALALVTAFGYRRVDAVVGHDFGSAGRGMVRADAARRVSLAS